MLARLQKDLAEHNRRLRIAKATHNAHAMRIEAAKIKEVEAKIHALRAPSSSVHRRPGSKTIHSTPKKHGHKKPHDRYEGVAVNCRNCSDMYKHYDALAKKWTDSGKLKTFWSPLQNYYVRRRAQARAFMRKCSDPAVARRIAKAQSERRELAAKIAGQKKLAAEARGRHDARQAQRHEEAAEQYERRERVLKVSEEGPPPEAAPPSPSWSPTASGEMIRPKGDDGDGPAKSEDGAEGEPQPSFLRKYGLWIIGGLAVGAVAAFGGKGKGGKGPTILAGLSTPAPRSFTAVRRKKGAS